MPAACRNRMTSRDGSPPELRPAQGAGFQAAWKYPLTDLPLVEDQERAERDESEAEPVIPAQRLFQVEH